MKEVRLITIEPADNGTYLKIIRDGQRTQKTIIWSTKALFLILAELLNINLAETSWKHTYNGENDP